jgi:hypothetical protein
MHNDGRSIASVLGNGVLRSWGQTSILASLWRAVGHTKANMSVFHVLEDEHAEWGNIAPCSALCIKDVCRMIKTEGHYSDAYNTKWWC